MGRATFFFWMLVTCAIFFAAYNTISMIESHYNPSPEGVDFDFDITWGFIDIGMPKKFLEDKLQHSQGKKRLFHVALTASNSAYNRWQCRIMYYWYKKFRDMPGSEMGGFTRILHSGSPDNLMDEMPTVVVEELPKGMDQVNPEALRHDTEHSRQTPDMVRDEQDELYRQLHRELESIDRRVTRARSRAYMIPHDSPHDHPSTSRVQGIRASSGSTRPRGRGTRGSGRRGQQRHMETLPEDGPSSSTIREQVPTIEAEREPVYDSDGHALTDGDFSSSSSSGLDDDIEE